MAYSSETILKSGEAIKSITATTAGTSILLPSHGTLTTYITKLIASNGATAGHAIFGKNAGAVAPTTTGIMLNNIYLGVAGTVDLDFEQPLQVPALKDFVVTAYTCTNITFAAVYYFAT